MEHTYGLALALVGATVPPHLAAGAEVPVLSGVQAQGDLLVYPISLREDELPFGDVYREPIPAEGLLVLGSDVTGHGHWLHRGFDSPGVEWAPGSGTSERLLLGYLQVPDGQYALLIHTDEHGANGIGPC